MDLALALCECCCFTAAITTDFQPETRTERLLSDGSSLPYVSSYSQNEPEWDVEQHNGNYADVSLSPLLFRVHRVCVLTQSSRGRSPKAAVNLQVTRCVVGAHKRKCERWFTTKRHVHWRCSFDTRAGSGAVFFFCLFVRMLQARMDMLQLMLDDYYYETPKVQFHWTGTTRSETRFYNGVC